MLNPKIHALILSTIIFFTAAFPYEVEDYFEGELPSFSQETLSRNQSFPDPNVLKHIGEISGVYAVNLSHIYVFHRADRLWNSDDFDENEVYTKQELGPIKKPTIALLVNGKIVKEFGEGIFFLPHSITVDQEGNIWTTDVALHQVFKFKQDDFVKPALVLGERFQPSDDDTHFCKPTDVKVAENGDFFVSDGYCNNRVLKFKADGSLITYWGQEDLSLPHSLALDARRDLVLVADRENFRVVAYTACNGTSKNCGKFVRQWHLPSAVYAVDVYPGSDDIYVLLDGQKEPSFVQILNFDLPYSVDSNEFQGFGMGHTMSALKQGPGFVVGSLISKCIPGISCALSAVFEKKDLHGGLCLYN